MGKYLYLGKRKGYSDCQSGLYEIGTNKKLWDEHFGWYAGGGLLPFCTKQFEKFTNVRLQKGEVKRIKSINIELEDI